MASSKPRTPAFTRSRISTVLGRRMATLCAMCLISGSESTISDSRSVSVIFEAAAAVLGIGKHPFRHFSGYGNQQIVRDTLTVGDVRDCNFVSEQIADDHALGIGFVDLREDNPLGREALEAIHDLAD